MKNEKRDLQIRLYGILVKVDAFCKANNIEYTLEGGSALGAYRHNGFIPWDDDLDIGMDINSYKRFCKLFVVNPPVGLALQTHQTDKNYINGFAKIRDLRTVSSEERIGADYKYKGLFIDVFPYEYVNPFVLRFSHIFFHRLQFWIVSKRVGRRDVLHYLLQVLYFVSECVDNILRQFSRILPKTYSYSYGCNAKARMHQYTKCMFFPTRNLKFEDNIYPCPGQIEEYLKNTYGNYMELPPIEERVNQHFVDFKEL